METIPNNAKKLGKYIIIKTTGRGTYAKTKMALNIEDNQYYALKILNKQNLNFNLDVVRNEIQILQQLNHPNIIKIVEYIEDASYCKKNGQVLQVFVIVLELAHNGELHDYLNIPLRLSEDIVRTLFKQLIEVVEYCHTKGITHRDLKPENILFDHEFNLKVIDFGFATLLNKTDDNEKFSTFTGTERYMAPEIFKRSYTGPQVDLFACGAILFYMLIKKPPFMIAQPTDYYYREFYSNFSRSKIDNFWIKHAQTLTESAAPLSILMNKDFQDLINSMLHPDPKKRLSIVEIKENVWYNGPTCGIDVIKIQMSEMRILIEKQNMKERATRKKVKHLTQIYLKKKNNLFGTASTEVAKERQQVKHRKKTNMSRVFCKKNKIFAYHTQTLIRDQHYDYQYFIPENIGFTNNTYEKKF